MSDPSQFIRACLDRKVWLFCSQCNDTRNFQDVEHLHVIENPAYRGTEPWWYEAKVFRCPVCETTQESVIQLQD